MSQITTTFLNHAAKAAQILWGLLPKERNIQSFWIIIKEAMEIHSIASHFPKKYKNPKVCYAL